MRIPNLLLALPGLLLVAGCAEPGTPPTYYGETPVHGRISAQAAADRSLESRIRSDLGRYGELGTVAPNVGVSARQGYVTLTGTVPAEKDRQMIDACVRNTAGVVTVNDQLQVGYSPTGATGQSTAVYAPATPPTVEVATPPPTPAYSEQRTVVATAPAAPAYTEIRPAGVYTETPATGFYSETGRSGLGLQVQASADTDRDLADRIANNVRADPVIPTLAPSVTVTVTGARAYVTGTVESGRQKHAVLEAVRRTPGVIDVVDRLRVR
jgi:osmotically-inducible protein OsmY